MVSDGPGGIWPRLVASMILNRQERAYWADLNEIGSNRRAWLLGRLAAKDAARLFIKNRYGLNLCPADIEIVNDHDGRLSLAPGLVEKLGGNLSIAISESEGRAVAIAGQFEGHRGIGLDLANLGGSNDDGQQIALEPGEKDLLTTCPTAQQDEWLRRSLCAKKAAAKALGFNMSESNLNLRIADLRIETGEALVAVSGEPARLLQERMSEELIVQTGREEDLIFAVALN
jgi:phosphopantetheinyl transferase (holo-ACP synthase)